MSAADDMVTIDFGTLLDLARMAGFQTAMDADPGELRAWLAAERQHDLDMSRPRPRRRKRHLRLVKGEKT